MRIYLIIAFITPSIFLSAQSRQDLYCNPDVVWAGIVEFDIIPDAKKNQDWEVYKISGFSSSGFKQITQPLAANTKTLGEYMVGSIWDWEVFASSTLENTVAPQMLELNYYPNGEPETFGDLGKEISRVEFNALRIRAILYYDKQQMLFLMKPLAAAIMRPEYDAPELVSSYYVVGWTPILAVEDQQTAQFPWGMRVYRDIPFKDTKGFKIEQKQEEVCFQMMDQLRNNADNIKLYEADDLEATKALTKDQVRKLGIVEIEQLDEFGVEPVSVKKSIPKENFIGIQLGFDLYWDAKNNQLLAKQWSFAPIHNTEDTTIWTEEPDLKRVFLRTLK